MGLRRAQSAIGHRCCLAAGRRAAAHFPQVSVNTQETFGSASVRNFPLCFCSPRAMRPASLPSYVQVNNGTHRSWVRGWRHSLNSERENCHHYGFWRAKLCSRRLRAAQGEVFKSGRTQCSRACNCMRHKPAARRIQNGSLKKQESCELAINCLLAQLFSALQFLI